jgi:hypothetical protein
MREQIDSGGEKEEPSAATKLYGYPNCCISVTSHFSQIFVLSGKPLPLPDLLTLEHHEDERNQKHGIDGSQCRK